MRLAALFIRNYKRIGAIECRVRIDKIVVLIGQNNAGKSTVLDAYQAFASGGEALNISHFHKEDEKNPIQITAVLADITEGDLQTIGEKWKHSDPEYGDVIKVRWVWTKADEKGKKQSYDPIAQDFVENGVGGWDSLILSRIPKPTRISPTEPTDATETKIVAMLKDHVKKKLKSDNSVKSDSLRAIEKLVQQIFEESRSEFDQLSQQITSSVSQMFPGITLEVVPRAKDSINETLLAGDSFLRVSTTGGDSTPLKLQGTGLQRALLWSALSAMSTSDANKKKTKGDVGHILLIDEPEAFLHPPTIRGARETLYDFALNNPDWQVLATTHSPIFIDLSKDHTTILRVDPSVPDQHFVATDNVSFDAPSRKRLQMIRECNPVVNEFFFYNHIVLVEGPTEQLAVTHVASKSAISVHVINCMGKANIPLFARVLNQFKVPYIVIHDSDTPNCKRQGRPIANPAWKTNERIRESVAESSGGVIFTQFPHFEGYFLGEELTSGKVDNVVDLISDESNYAYEALLNTYQRILRRDANLLTTTAEAFERGKSEYLARTGLDSDPKWADRPERIAQLNPPT